MCRVRSALFFAFLSVLLGSCSRLLGWGVLLWATEDPAIPSGTVLPVYIRSNIDQVWVVGVPEAYRQADRQAGRETDKFEIPLWQLELSGRKKAAQARVVEFAEYAKLYAETIQDGLPIREEPDNSARRVYRLRMGQIIKILAKAEGNPAISATGDPLPGDWYRVLTQDGAVGCCFSYRLRLFEYAGGPLLLAPAAPAPPPQEDTELEQLLSRSWHAEWYGSMISGRRIDLEDLRKRWRFTPGADTGIAHLFLPTADLSFSYTGIQNIGSRAWRFEGAPLQMRLQSDTVLTVQYTENGGALRSAIFVALPMDLDDIISQETERRLALFRNLYALGPSFQSANYGVLSFTENSRFTWTGNNILVPQIIPVSALGSGSVDMGLFLDRDLEQRYTGAFILRFDGIAGTGAELYFMYTVDDQGIRIEYVPPDNLEGVTVMRRGATPTILYFFKTERQTAVPAQTPFPLEF
jgi:hypothetical protein